MTKILATTFNRVQCKDKAIYNPHKEKIIDVNQLDDIFNLENGYYRISFHRDCFEYIVNQNTVDLIYKALQEDGVIFSIADNA